MEPALAEKIVHGLKAAGIDFITYLPESRLSQILPLLRADGTVQMVAAASEQEAITIAAGAALGGKRVACYMESTGPLRLRLLPAHRGQADGRADPVAHRLSGQFCRSAEQLPLRHHRQCG